MGGNGDWFFRRVAGWIIRQSSSVSIVYCNSNYFVQVKFVSVVGSYWNSNPTFVADLRNDLFQFRCIYFRSNIYKLIMKWLHIYWDWC
mmetsp:Transcript_44279/g.92248  ORF Transcript_44279/g.92248 Transcript_44279/m.92248 type:complete len:88 (-) Transcript_44279:179-442(-)